MVSERIKKLFKRIDRSEITFLNLVALFYCGVALYFIFWIVKMSDPIKNEVDAKIKSAKVVIFSKNYCPYCKRAIEAIESLGPKEVLVVELVDNPNAPKIQEYQKVGSQGDWFD